MDVLRPLKLSEVTTPPATPGTGEVVLYAENKVFYSKNSDGLVTSLGSGGSTPLFPPAFLYQTIKVVQTLADFPTPIGNEIFLVDNTIYFIDNGDLDISGYTIVFAQRSQLNGFGQNVSKISSTTAGTLGNPYVFFKSGTNLFMNDLEIECKGNYQLIWEHIGNGTVPEGESFDLNRINILNEQTAGHGCQLGYVKDIRQGFIGTFSCFNFEQGFITAGAWTGGFRVDNTIFIFCSGVFFGSDPLDPVTFARRMSSNANLSVPSGSIGYDFPQSSFPMDGQYQLQEGNASGAGTYVTLWSGIHPSRYPEANFKNNTGIQNTFAGVEWISTSDNVVVTAVANTWYKVPIASATVKDATWVSYANGVITYDSSNSLDASIITRISATGKANDIVQIKIVKTDSLLVETDLIISTITIQGSTAQGRAENVTIPTTAQMNLDDELSVWVRNTSGTSNVTVLQGANFILGQK